MSCSGIRCPMQYPYDVENCSLSECKCRTEKIQVTPELIEAIEKNKDKVLEAFQLVIDQYIDQLKQELTNSNKIITK